MSTADRVLLGAAVMLAGLALWPWVAPASFPSPLATADGAPQAPPVTTLPSLATFAAAFDRPLFSPSRRPPPEGKAPVVDGNDTGRYRLLGLLTMGQTRRALIADGSRRFEITEGASLGSWTVARIEQDRVVLSSPAGRMEMRLRRAEGYPEKRQR